MFTKLLVDSGTGFMNRMNEKSEKIFCDYNFKPVRINNKTAIPDYFENKHLYFLKIINGTVAKAW
jgi:hypothetical protein